MSISLKYDKSIDKSDMLSKILEFPDQLLRGRQIAQEIDEEIHFDRYKNIVFGGMGGSAIAGDIIKSLFINKLPVPLIVNRGYRLPGFVGSESLFIASSYSGNTEETLQSTYEAIERGCSVLCVTAGGNLGGLARNKGFPVFSLPEGYPPRAALGFSLGVFLTIFGNNGVGDISEADIVATVSFLKECGKSWTPKEGSECLPLTLASQLKGKIPLINASSESLEAVGLRWKAQLNENSKTHAFYHSFPEMNHNEIVGWEDLSATKTFFPHLIMIMLRSVDDSPRIRLRMDITKRIVKAGGGKVLNVEAEGEPALSRMLYLIFLGDLVSYYLAMLYGVDPTEIEKINQLKSELTQHK
jgi:glucose/mannose-6-phosphate isomerase